MLIGRGDALRELDAAARASRLVTLVGPMGVGKTRLARQLAEEVDGAATLVDLSDQTSELGLIAQTARALEVSEDELAHALAGGPRTLVLDNFEPLVDAAAPRVAEWLERAPALRVVVTSRRRLALSMEHVFEVAPLASEHARALFVARARQGDASYAPDEGELDAIDRICSALDGLPLAIELAAARLRVMSARELALRMDERFVALAEGPRDAPSRHATLEDAIESSWRALDDDARAALAQCAIFEGGFDLTAAEAVLDGGPRVIDRLTQLVDRSLLVRERSPSGTRFRLLASIREYARAHGEPGDASTRHADYFLEHGLAKANRYEHRRGSEERDWLLREEANLWAVHRRALVRADRSRALDAVLALQPILLARGPAALRLSSLDAALAERAGIDALRLAWALLARADTLERLGRAEAALETGREALALAESTESPRLEVVACWRIAAHVAQSDIDEARALFERALALTRTSGDRYYELRVLTSYAEAALERGELDEAAALLARAETAQAEVRDETYRGVTRGLAGRLAHHRGQLDEARTRYAQAIELHRAIDNRRWLPRLHAQLGLLCLELGDLAEACAHHARGVGLASGSDAAELALLGGLTAEETGDAERASERYAAAARDGTDEVRAAAQLGALRVRGGEAPDRSGYAEIGAAHLALRDGRWDDRALAASGTPWLRDAARRLSAELERAARGAMLVGPEARWIRWDDRVVSLERTLAPRLVLLALVESHRDPGRAWSIEELFSRGWPNERATEKAASSRVYVALSALRKAGLEDAIERTDDGYRLREGLRVLRSSSESAP